MAHFVIGARETDAERRRRVWPTIRFHGATPMNSHAAPCFGPQDRDAYMLRKVAALRLAVAFECRNCHKLAQRDILDLIARYGPATKLGELRRHAVCTRCKRRAAEILLRQPGIRGGRSWRPHPPSATRD